MAAHRGRGLPMHQSAFRKRALSDARVIESRVIEVQRTPARWTTILHRLVRNGPFLKLSMSNNESSFFENLSLFWLHCAGCPGTRVSGRNSGSLWPSCWLSMLLNFILTDCYNGCPICIARRGNKVNSSVAVWGTVLQWYLYDMFPASIIQNCPGIFGSGRDLLFWLVNR